MKPLARGRVQLRVELAARTARPSSATSTGTAGGSPAAIRCSSSATSGRARRSARSRTRSSSSGSRRSPSARAAYLGRPDADRPGIDGRVAFFCAEFGFHASLPIYSGGLGVLAGDILKEASDQALPMVGIGLLYRRGYFRQRLDLAGRQHEYWVAIDPKSLPMARVTNEDGSPLRLTVTLFG